MRSFKLMFVLVSSLALVAACGDDDDNGGADAAPNVDAPTGGGADAPTGGGADAPTGTGITDEHLDESCSMQTDCGGLLGNGYECLVLDNAHTAGLCASACSSDADCTMNYDGPGTPACVLPLSQTEVYCGVTCTSNDDCAVGMECTELNAQLSICYPIQS